MRLETGLSFIEFNYQLLQSYDYLVLFRRFGCRLQMGGDDQWGNIVAGMDLIRRAEGVEAFALTSPLITRSDGKKMGKSEGGALFLAPHLVSPYEFYQFWVNVPDADLNQFFLRFTFLPVEEVRTLCSAKGCKDQRCEARLALEITSLVHGEAAAKEAAEASRAAFQTDDGADLSGFRRSPCRGEKSRKGFPWWTFSFAPDCASPRATRAGSFPQAGRTWSRKNVTDHHTPWCPLTPRRMASFSFERARRGISASSWAEDGAPCLRLNTCTRACSSFMSSPPRPSWSSRNLPSFSCARRKPFCPGGHPFPLFVHLRDQREHGLRPAIHGDPWQPSAGS